MPKTKLSVVIDSREKKPYPFIEDDDIGEVVRASLKSGDYSLKGAEHIISIERKASTAEIAQNIFDDRFFRELERLQSYRFVYILCEFSLRDVLQFPLNSGIPKYKLSQVRVTGKVLLKKITEIQLNYGIPFIFCGGVDESFEMCFSLLKRANELLIKEKNT